MNALIVGASAGLGRALAEDLAGRGWNVFLVASDARDLAPLASDIALRFGVRATWHAADLRNFDVQALHSAYRTAFSDLDALLLVAAVTYLEQDTGSLPPRMMDDLVNIDLVAPMKIVNAFLPDLAGRPGARIVGISSIAAARPRRINMVYGTAKRGLEFYLEAIRHYLANRPCHVQIYRMGYLDTQMNAGRQMALPAARPSAMARRIVERLGRGGGIWYLPRWWMGIALVLQLMPWPIFRRFSR